MSRVRDPLTGFPGAAPGWQGARSEEVDESLTRDTSAAIFVGGQARRLGGALKPALAIAGTSILARQLAAVKDAGISEVLLIGRWPAPPIEGVRHLPDAVPGGALAALYTALIVAITPVVVVLAGDLPFVDAAMIRDVAAIGDHDAVVPRTNRRWHPLCAGYHRRLALMLKMRLHSGALRVSDVLADVRVREVNLPAGEHRLLNVNTPDDHSEAERLARS